MFRRLCWMTLIATLWAGTVHGGTDRVSRASRIVASMDYIPFTSIKDGCYARALYMGMELTVNRIPSSNQYIFGKLRPRGAAWKWHVAPLVEDPASGRVRVLDPSLAPRPLRRNDWIRRSAPRNRPLLAMAPVSQYKKKEVRPQARPVIRHTPVRSLRQLPGFRMADIASACRVAWVHIGKERLSMTGIRRKRQRLERRTDQLVRRLIRMGKLPGGSGLLECSSASFRT